MKSSGVDIDLTDDDDIVSKIQITDAILRNKGSQQIHTFLKL